MTGKIAIAVGLLAALVMFLLPAPPEPGALRDAPEEVALISARDLSDRIITGGTEMMLIDLRPEEEWQENGIKTSVCMPLEGLDLAALRALPTHRKVVLYGADTEEGLEALERIAPFIDHAAVLEGGYEAWEAAVLNPEEPASDANPVAWQDYERHLSVANYYLGKTDSTAAVDRPERPVQPVLRPRPALAPSEGC